ncbi:MAG TPA: transporter [Bryobacteraceae bacterium]|nr:transporter [Bryobacteraceae bacterium]
MPGMTPHPGGSLLLEFNDFYQANGLADSRGHNEIPGFHLRVGAFAVKFVHSWDVHFLGGSLVSYAALPLVYEHLDGPFGLASKTGIGNLDLQPIAVAYHRGGLHWWYGYDVFTPGFSYHKNDLVNIGQHNFAGAPSAAVTYLSGHGAELSSKVQYIVNGKNNQTQYRSGNEMVWEYAAMQNVVKKVAIGVNGFYYQQTTDDLQNGLRVGDGHRGRDFAVGPEVRCHVGHLVMIAKYQRDTLVQNRPMGNSFWLQVGVPLGAR